MKASPADQRELLTADSSTREARSCATRSPRCRRSRRSSPGRRATTRPAEPRRASRPSRGRPHRAGPGSSPTSAWVEKRLAPRPPPPADRLRRRRHAARRARSLQAGEAARRPRGHRADPDGAYRGIDAEVAAAQAGARRGRRRTRHPRRGEGTPRPRSWRASRTRSPATAPRLPRRSPSTSSSLYDAARPSYGVGAASASGSPRAAESL